MSRNVRIRNSAPIKAVKREDSDSSLSDLSDDSGYSAVEALSDSEDDDEDDVKAAEEEHITHDWGNSKESSPRPIEEVEEGDDADEEDVDGDEDEDDEDDINEADESSPGWEGIQSDSNAEAAAAADTPERRVRFDVPDSDGDSTETDEDAVDFFPDIFVEQASLDPTFRREIEQEERDDSSNSGSFWDFYGMSESAGAMVDFGGFPSAPGLEADAAVFASLFEDDDSTPVATPMTSQEVPTAASTPAPSPEKAGASSLDGYESDGDTTEEEDPPEQPMQCQPRREGADDASDTEVTEVVRPRRGKPRVGRFNLTTRGNKPVAVVNPRTGKLMIFKPSTTIDFALSPEQFNFPLFDPNTQASPILSHSGNLMMGAMMFSQNTFGDFMNTQAVGPPGAFFPMDLSGTAVETEEDDEEADEDEEEHRLNVDDFITFDDDGSSMDEDGDDNDVFVTTPARPSSATAASPDITSLLEHFQNNANIVGAFRRDQANSQLIRNGKATRESLAFSSPFYQGTLRGIKDGRLETTNVAISPLRRKKKRMPDLTSSPLSAASQKRKATSEQPWVHKRQRSIPELESLRI